jgi:hypothetical protein
VHIDNILKSQAAWEHMLALDLEVPREIERELLPSAPLSDMLKETAIPRRSGERSTQQHNNVARCLELDATQWLAAVDWAKKSGQFSDLTLNVAGTLAGYAAQGWSRMPSPKQAQHGAAIIEAARSVGVLNP